jgi:hypothetical protein
VTIFCSYLAGEFLKNNITIRNNDSKIIYAFSGVDFALFHMLAVESAQLFFNAGCKYK